MLNMDLNSPITEDEKKIISEILMDKNSCNRSLFIQLMGPVARHLLDIAGRYRCFELDMLFEQALVTAVLRVKINIEINSESMRFTAKDLARAVLQYYPDTAEKDNVLKEAAESIKRYNKHQCRSFFQHTKKNDAFFFKSDINEKKGFNLGRYLEHERYICEIEYMLKKGKSTADDEVQKAVDTYALNRIRCIPEWKGLTLEQLNSLRKTYSKLRPFFLEGTGTSRKIPDYCYKNYLDCFRLIYEYVTFYTPLDLLDAAYFALDNSYTLDSYISVNFVNRMPALNDFSILPVLKPYYVIFLGECLQVLRKIYSYMDVRKTDSCKSAADIYIHESAGYLRERIVNLHKCSEGMPFHDWAYDYEVLPLDGLILYNTFWKGYTMVSQKIFLEIITEKANEEDPDFRRLRLAFEITGTDFSENNNEQIYNDIIRQIQSARDVCKDVLITHLLKEVYKKKPLEGRNGMPETACSSDTGTGSLDIRQPENILNRLSDELPGYIRMASGRSDSKMWDKMAENLTYQFIYRNYYELDRYNVLLENSPGLHNSVKEFLKRYDLKLVSMIDGDNCPWLSHAVENLKGTSGAYKKFMDYSRSYAGEKSEQRLF